MRKILLLLSMLLLIISAGFLTGCDDETSDEITEIRYNMLYEWLQDGYVRDIKTATNGDDFLNVVKLFEDPNMRNHTLDINPYFSVSAIKADTYYFDPNSGGQILLIRRIQNFDSTKRTTALDNITYTGGAVSAESFYEFYDFADSAYTASIKMKNNAGVEVYNGQVKYELVNGAWLVTYIELNITGESDPAKDDHGTWEIAYNSKGYITSYKYKDEQNDTTYLFTLTYTNETQLSSVQYQKGNLAFTSYSTVFTDSFPTYTNGKPVKRTQTNASNTATLEEEYTYDSNNDLYLINKNDIANSKVTVYKATLGSLGYPEQVLTYNNSEADANLTAKRVYTFESGRPTLIMNYTYTNGANETKDNKTEYTYTLF